MVKNSLMVLLGISTITLIWFSYSPFQKYTNTSFLDERQNISGLARSNKIADSYFEEQDNLDETFTKTGNIISPMMDWYTKIQSFDEEAKCMIPKAVVKQITLYDMEHEELCSSGNFHFVHIILENPNGQYTRITGITPPREYIQCNYGVNGWYSFDRWYEYLDMLPEKMLTIGETIRNIVVDHEYRYLSTPYTSIFDLEKYEPEIYTKVDISHLPECKPNIQ